MIAGAVQHENRDCDAGRVIQRVQLWQHFGLDEPAVEPHRCPDSRFERRDLGSDGRSPTVAVIPHARNVEIAARPGACQLVIRSGFHDARHHGKHAEMVSIVVRNQKRFTQDRLSIAVRYLRVQVC